MGRPRSGSPRDPLPSAPLPSPFLSPLKKETPLLGLGSSSDSRGPLWLGGGRLLGIELGHLLHVDADALAVKEQEVDILQRGRARVVKVG